MRSKQELDASRHLYDAIIWVDASDRVDPEDKSSCTVTIDDADIVLDNNKTLADLYMNIQVLNAFVSSNNLKEVVAFNRENGIQTVIGGGIRHVCP
jgi:hypothetical protein